MMWHRLALALGRPIAELKRTMSRWQFRQWCTFYRLEPWGIEVSSWQSGMMAHSIISAVWGMMGGTGDAIRDESAFFEQFRPSLAFSAGGAGDPERADPDSPFASMTVKQTPASGTADQMYYQCLVMAQQCGGKIIYPDRD